MWSKVEFNIYYLHYKIRWEENALLFQKKTKNTAHITVDP